MTRFNIQSSSRLFLDRRFLFAVFFFLRLSSLLSEESDDKEEDASLLVGNTSEDEDEEGEDDEDEDWEDEDDEDDDEVDGDRHLQAHLTGGCGGEPVELEGGDSSDSGSSVSLVKCLFSLVPIGVSTPRLVPTSLVEVYTRGDIPPV